ncbi:podocin [Polyodon spathula]|uniref:podocin n=1 Tax=Polyodon spathula TaxID=7913 RepID=UPI001B7E9F1B|nr:podocin [Polyodon spathula]
MLLSAEPLSSRMEKRSRSTSRSSRTSSRKAKGTSKERAGSLEPGERKRGRSNSRSKRREEGKGQGALGSDGKVGSSTVVEVDNVLDSEQDSEPEETAALLDAEGLEEGMKLRTLGFWEWILVIFAMALVTLSLPISIWFCVKIVREYERAVIFRLGHLLPGKPRGPGLFFYVPLLDVYHKVDLRIRTFEIPFHEIVTKDLVTLELSAVCYYRLENAPLCLTAVCDSSTALRLLTESMLKSCLAHRDFTSILLDRKSIAEEVKIALDAVTCRWGIKVERTEIKDLRLPAELQHTLSVEAEAQRMARIRVIAAEGERAASESLRLAAETLSGSPQALQLRYLQTLHSLTSERSCNTILPLPFDLLHLLTHSESTHTPREQGEPKKDSPML